MITAGPRLWRVHQCSQAVAVEEEVATVAVEEEVATVAVEEEVAALVLLPMTRSTHGSTLSRIWMRRVMSKFMVVVFMVVVLAASSIGDALCDWPTSRSTAAASRTSRWRRQRASSSRESCAVLRSVSTE